MTEGNRDKRARQPRANPRKADGQPQPGWALGLRQLYDAVLDEPLPDTFKDLLSKLDDRA